MCSKKFEYSIFVGIGDTNVEGNVYWTRYLEWFAKAREVFLISISPNFMELFSSGLRIATHETNLKHMSSAFFTNKIILEISIGEIKQSSVKMLVDFLKEPNREKIAEGWQILVFTNDKGKPIAIPPEIKEAGLKYLVKQGRI